MTTLPTRKERATTALRNAITRAEAHLALGQVEKARTSLRRGDATAGAWMDGTHREIEKARAT